MIDSHCHLDFPEFDADRAQILQRARKVGVRGIVLPGVTEDHWQRMLNLCAQEEGMFTAPGLHPLFVSQHQNQHLQQLEVLAAHPAVVAIAEIGLDFYLGREDEPKQMRYFCAQLEIAKRLGLPVMLHVRRAHDQVLKQLRQTKLASGGICHAFNGSLQQAMQYVDLGFKLAFGGMLTYERSNRLRTLASELPLDALVLETDAPDLPPTHHQYQRNSPEWLPEIARALAEIRGLAFERVAEQTAKNTCAVLTKLPLRLLD